MENCIICENEIDKQYSNGEMIWNKGHNAEPIADGQCCTICNSTMVIPERFARIFQSLNKGKTNEKNAIN